MAYQAGDAILDDEYLAFINGTNGVNTLASTGTGNLGLGQSAVAAVTAGDTISASQWNNLFDQMDLIAAHTGVSVDSTTDVSAGDSIAVKSTLEANLLSLKNGVAAGTVAGANIDAITSDLSLASGAVFDQSHVMEVSYTFLGGNEARWFFNAGGKVGITSAANTATHTTGKDTVMTDLFTQMGSFRLGSTASTVTGTPADTVSGDLNIGYYDLTTSYQNVFTLTETTGTYNTSYNNQLSVVVEAKTSAAHADGAGNNGEVVTLRFTIDADDGVTTDYDTGDATQTGTGQDGVQQNSMGPTTSIFGTMDPNNSGGLDVTNGMNTITVAKVSSTRNDDGSASSL